MAMEISVSNAKAQLTEFVRRAEAGDEIVLTRHGQPAVRLARQVGEIYRRWGRGFHPAALNFGDCFAYALAKERGCSLLYSGDDFAKTDIAGVLPTA